MSGLADRSAPSTRAYSGGIVATDYAPTMTVTTPLPRAIVAAVVNWQSLRKSPWSLPKAVVAEQALAQAAQLAADSERAELAGAIKDFAIYLRSLVDGEVALPSPAQTRRLQQHEEQCLRVLRREMPAPATHGAAAAVAAAPAAPVATKARAQILVLAPRSPLWADLAARLDSARAQVITCTDVGTLLQRMAAAIPVAVLVDESNLMDLGSVTDRLELMRQQDALGATVIYFNRSRDNGKRLLALAGGADASLEGEDIDHLLVRVSELVDVLHQHEHLRVLLVEDDRSQAMFCEAVLRKQGMDVMVATDARQALDQLRAFGPDLVLVDLHMPGIDGIKLTTLIREDPQLALLPIVFLTGEQDEAKRFDAMRAGGDDYLTKPVRPRHLVTTVGTRARRARLLKNQIAERSSMTPSSRLLHAGQVIALLRELEQSPGRRHGLLLCAADSGHFANASAHAAVEREHEYEIGRRLQDSIRDQECMCVWGQGGFLVLLRNCADEELDRRAEELRLALTALLVQGSASVAVVTIPEQDPPAPETLIDLAQRTAVLARHAGGGRLRRALAEAQSDLPAELSLAIQKVLTVALDDSNTQVQYQPVVPLRGAFRPQYHLHMGLQIEGGRIATRRQWGTLARHAGRTQDLDHLTFVRGLNTVMSLRVRQPGLRVLLALTAESLIDTQFRQRLIDAVHQRVSMGEPGIVISVDQSESLLRQKPMQTAFAQLREARLSCGIGRVSIDETGSDMIAALRPDLIAVDASAVLGSQAASATLERARDLGTEVVAHFIGDAQTLARLFALGIDYGMGAFIGAPGTRPDYDFGE